MPKPIAFNAGTKKNGSLKQGNVELGNLTNVDYGANYGGLTWYNSLDADTGYVIMTDTYTMGLSTFGNSKPVIWKTPDFTDNSVLNTINGLPNRIGQTRFTATTEAFTWSSSSGAFFNLSNNMSSIVTDNLTLFLDGTNVSSYPKGGTTWYDLSGNGNHGALTNGPTFDSINGGTIYFDGTNDYGLISNSSSLDISSGDFTIESFFYYPSSVTIDNKYRPIFVLTPSNSTSENMYFGLVRSGLIGGTPLYFYFTNTANKSGFITKLFANYVYGGTDYNAGGKWNHVVLTQINNTLYCYINGSQYASISGNYIANSGNQNLYIGASTQYGEYNQGNISSVRVYKGKGLTSSEVAQNFCETTPIIKNGLVLNVDAGNPLSYVSGTTIWNDRSGNGFKGTITNGPTFNSENLGSIVFDGIDDYVIFGNPSKLQFNNPNFSYGCWFYWTNTNTLATLMGKRDGNNTVNVPSGSNYNQWGLTISDSMCCGPAGKNIGNCIISDGWVTGGCNLSAPLPNYAGWVYGFITVDTYVQKIYINGEVSGNTNNNLNGATFNIVGRSFYVGATGGELEGSIIGPYNNKIAHVQVYNRTLSDSEVLQNYTALKGRFGL